MIVEVGPAIEQIQKLKKFLPEKNREELAQILVYGEKMKAEGEKKEKEFWNKYNRIYFGNLLVQYEESKEKFIKSLALEEKKMLDNLSELSKEKFYNEYLYERIVYSGEINDEYTDNGSIIYENENGKFDLEKFKDWVNSSKDSLKPGMRISLEGNDIGDEGVKILTEAWKDKLQPGIKIRLGENNLGYKGVKILAEAWKDSLKPGMEIRLEKNDLGDEGLKILSEIWNDSLKPGMVINMCRNDFGEEGIKSMMQNLKLKEGVTLCSSYDKILDDTRTKIKEWVQGYKDQGVNCEVKF